MSAFLHKIADTIIVTAPGAIILGGILKGIELLQKRYWHPADRDTRR